MEWHQLPFVWNGTNYQYGMAPITITDGNKNVTALLDASGNRVAEYVYGPFGQTVSATGSMAPINPFRFSSEFHDDETGLVYYNYRYYNPNLGRWTKRDPIEEDGGSNLYGIVKNNLIMDIDIIGLKRIRSQIIFLEDTKQDSTFNFSGFFRWIIPIGGGRQLNWRHFDKNDQAANIVIKTWWFKNHKTLDSWMKKFGPGEYNVKNIDGIIILPPESCQSHNNWISAYELKIFKIEKYKLTVTLNCDKHLEIAIQLYAWDRSDFNKGDSFGPFGLIKDDWFIWIRDNTFMGKDYDIWAYGNYMYKVSITEE